MSRHLVIKALHREESFLSKGTDKLVNRIAANDDEVIVRDLYGLNFNPVLTTSDFKSLEEGNIPDDIRREQDFINRAEYLWFIFPIWWTSMPAILKGYIDRIFLRGFAYRMNNDTPVGLLRSKKVILINSMGMSEEEYKAEGFFKAMSLTVDKGIFEFSGMEIIEHKYFTSIMSADECLRERYFLEITKLADEVTSNRALNNQDKSVA